MNSINDRPEIEYVKSVQTTEDKTELGSLSEPKYYSIGEADIVIEKWPISDVNPEHIKYAESIFSALLAGEANTIDFTKTTFQAVNDIVMGALTRVVKSASEDFEIVEVDEAGLSKSQYPPNTENNFRNPKINANVSKK